MSDFFKLHFNVGELAEPTRELQTMVLPQSLESMVSAKSEQIAARVAGVESVSAREIKTATAEHAARYYTEELLKAQGSEQLLAITDQSSAALVPNLRVVRSESTPLTNSNTVVFEQRTHEVPVFGSKAVVEMDQDGNRLLAFDGNLAAPPLISHIADLSPSQAFSRLAEFCRVSPRDAGGVKLEAAPRLVFFEEVENARWHLAYHFKSVPFAPPEQAADLPLEFVQADIKGCSHAHSPRESSPIYDYLLDAHDGEIIFWFSSTPRLDVPVPCQGLDDIGTNRQFFGLNIGGNTFSLHDPQRNISTYDLALGVVDPNNVPTQPISHPAANFQSTNPAAVSAHYYATVVFDFFNNLLQRKSIDNKGMLLKSVVNAVERAGDQEWKNAAWWKGHMWYGRAANGSSGFISYSRHLDVIGHELAHGVTETESGLIYAHLSGALNESFSDIFGVLIKNWDPVMGFLPLQAWSWEIGPGLGRNGGPIRNFANPAATGQPTHFNQYRPLPNTPQGDWGGVHFYSGIHNLAVYKVLVDANGQPNIPVNDVAILYYLTLTKLTAKSNFLDCRRTLLNVAGTYYSHNFVLRGQRLNAIGAAYDAVGIQ